MKLTPHIIEKFKSDPLMNFANEKPVLYAISVALFIIGAMVAFHDLFEAITGNSCPSIKPYGYAVAFSVTHTFVLKYKWNRIRKTEANQSIEPIVTTPVD